MEPETIETVYIGICPKCSSLNAVPIFRGFPSAEMREQVKQGRAVWAGCSLMEEDAPNWMCKSCGYRWFYD